MSAMLLLSVGELLTRLMNYGGTLYDVEMFRYSRLLKRRAPPEAAEMHHWHIPSSSAILQGVPVSINSKGLRDVEHRYERSPLRSRILVLGDSVSFGWGVSLEETYPKVLERLLNAGSAPPRYEVINGAVGNYTASRMIALYNHELWKYSPDTVILALCITCANDAPRSRATCLFDTPLQFPVLLWSLANRVAVANGLGSDFRRFYTELSRDDNPLFIHCRSRIETFLARMKRTGTRVVVCWIPDVVEAQVRPYPYQFVADKIFGIAARHGASTLGLLPAVQGVDPRLLVNSSEDRHPNALAHRRVAEYLAPRLRALCN